MKSKNNKVKCVSADMERFVKLYNKCSLEYFSSGCYLEENKNNKKLQKIKNIFDSVSQTVKKMIKTLENIEEE